MLAVITDVHYRMSLALIRDLAEAGVTVVACETEDQPAPPGFASRHVSRRVTLPTEGTLDALFALCEELKREFGEAPALLPVGAKTLAALSEAQSRFSAVCGLAVAEPSQLELLNDKNAVHALGQRLGLAVPRQYARQDAETEAAFYARVPLPCVVKPACGEKFGLHAESRYKIAHTAAQLENAYTHFQTLTGEAPLVQEYLPGGALGCSVLADHGQVLAALCHRRLREYPVTGGPSSCCESIQAPELEAMARQIIAAVGFTGTAMLEFKEDAQGHPRLLECNPRVWGTYPLTRVSGSNFALLWYSLAAGRALPAYQKPKPVKMAFYPSDLAAALGYLKKGRVAPAFSALADLLNPGVKNGLHERSDPKPGRLYRKSLFARRRKP